MGLWGLLFGRFDRARNVPGLADRIQRAIRTIEDLLETGVYPENVVCKDDVWSLPQILEELKWMHANVDVPRSRKQRTRYTWLITNSWRGQGELGTELFRIEEMWQGRVPQEALPVKRH